MNNSRFVDCEPFIGQPFFMRIRFFTFLLSPSDMLRELCGAVFFHRCMGVILRLNILKQCSLFISQTLFDLEFVGFI